MKLVTRSEWGAKPSRYSLVYIASTQGVKVHYEGTEVPASLANPENHSKCDDRMRALQASHLANTRENYSDIAYNFVVCPHGYAYEGRGLNRQTGANGTQTLNKQAYAVCAMLGNSGLTQPTDAQLSGLRDVIDLCRSQGEAGTMIGGHRDGHPTACPGDPLYAWVKKGAPRPEGSTHVPPSTPPPPAPKPVGARGSLGSWPGSPPVKYGRENGSVQKLQLRLRNAVGPVTAKRLNPNGATGYYGSETASLVKYALRNHPETWNKGDSRHDGHVGAKSWAVINKL